MGAFSSIYFRRTWQRKSDARTNLFLLLFKGLSPDGYKENWGEKYTDINHSNLPLNLKMLRNAPFLLLLEVQISESTVWQLRARLPTSETWFQPCCFVTLASLIACASFPHLQKGIVIVSILQSCKD